MILDPRPPVTLPQFSTVRRGGYRPLEVDRWVASVSRRVDELTVYADSAEQRVRLAEQRVQVAEDQVRLAEDRARDAVRRAAGVEARSISDALDQALRAVLDEAGKATDAVLAEARARAVALVAVAQQESDRVTADAAVQGEVTVARRRQEIDAVLADRLAEQDRLAGEVEVLRAAQRLAAGSARSLLDHLGAVAAALDPAAPEPSVVIDLTEGSQSDRIAATRRAPSDPRSGGGDDDQQLSAEG